MEAMLPALCLAPRDCTLAALSRLSRVFFCVSDKAGWVVGMLAGLPSPSANKVL
tara:strand:- start:57 stop:218 length:162 start_codon:yes stop_codon:yes gene_type:complete